MKKTAVIIAVLLLLTTQACLAVDLEAGWYVKLGGFSAFGWRDGEWQGIGWTFTDGLGAFGPLEVTNPDPWWPQRLISVPDNAFGVPAGTSVELWATPDCVPDFALSDVGLHWETNYDAAYLQLRLLMFNEDAGFTVLWSQTENGETWGYGNVLNELQIIPVGYTPVFQVVVVPEPSTLWYVAGLAVLLPKAVRRQRR